MLAAAVVGDSDDVLQWLETEHDGAMYVAESIEKVFGKAIIDRKPKLPL